MAFWLHSRQTFVQNWCKYVLQTFFAKHALQAHRSLSIFPLYKHSCTIFTQQNAKLCRLHHVSILLIHLITTAAIIFNVIKTWAIMMTVFIMISYQNPHHYFAKRSLAQFSLTLIHSPSPSLQLSIQSDARVRFVNAQLSLYLQKCNNCAIGWKHNLKLRRAMQNHAKRRKNTENNITKDAFIPGTTFIQYCIIHLYCDTIFI